MARPGRNLAVSSSRQHPALGLHAAPGHGHPFRCERLPGCSATPSPSIATDGMPGHPRAAGPSVTHTQATLSGSCGRTVAISRRNPGIRGWERSHQPTPAPRAALPVTATSSSKGTGRHRLGTRSSLQRGQEAAGLKPLPLHITLPPPQQPVGTFIPGPRTHATITSLLPKSQDLDGS